MISSLGKQPILWLLSWLALAAILCSARPSTERLVIRRQIARRSFPRHTLVRRTQKDKKPDGKKQDGNGQRNGNGGKIMNFLKSSKSQKQQPQQQASPGAVNQSSKKGWQRIRDGILGTKVDEEQFLRPQGQSKGRIDQATNQLQKKKPFFSNLFNKKTNDSGRKQQSPNIPETSQAGMVRQQSAKNQQGLGRQSKERQQSTMGRQSVERQQVNEAQKKPQEQRFDAQHRHSLNQPVPDDYGLSKTYDVGKSGPAMQLGSSPSSSNSDRDRKKHERWPNLSKTMGAKGFETSKLDPKHLKALHQSKEKIDQLHLTGQDSTQDISKFRLPQDVSKSSQQNKRNERLKKFASQKNIPQLSNSFGASTSKSSNIPEQGKEAKKFNHKMAQTMGSLQGQRLKGTEDEGLNPGSGSFDKSKVFGAPKNHEGFQAQSSNFDRKARLAFGGSHDTKHTQETKADQEFVASMSRTAKNVEKTSKSKGSFDIDRSQRMIKHLQSKAYAEDEQKSPESEKSDQKEFQPAKQQTSGISLSSKKPNQEVTPAKQQDQWKSISDEKKKLDHQELMNDMGMGQSVHRKADRDQDPVLKEDGDPIFDSKQSSSPPGMEGYKAYNSHKNPFYDSPETQVQSNAPKPSSQEQSVEPEKSEANQGSKNPDSFHTLSTSDKGQDPNKRPKKRKRE